MREAQICRNNVTSWSRTKSARYSFTGQGFTGVDSFRLRVESFHHSYRHARYIASIGNKRRAEGRYLQRYSGTNLQRRMTILRRYRRAASHSYARGLQLGTDETASQLRIFF